MKKNLIFSLFLGLALILSISSCKKDENTTPPASVVANFTISPDADLTAPVEITFTNTSVVPATAGTATYAWNFGDGTGTSTDESPVYTYTNAGNYTITLTISTPNADDAVKTMNITVSSGVLFFEDFETITEFPNTWVIIDEDGGTPDSPDFNGVSNWIISNSDRFESNVAIATSYFTDDPYPDADDWMITPAITIQANTFLSWQAMSLTSSGNYLDDYEVYVSTTTQDIAGCNAVTGKMIKQVLQEQASTSSTTPGLGVQSYEIDLSEFAGKDVYIAFRLMTPAPGGDELGIDNIKVFLK